MEFFFTTIPYNPSPYYQNLYSTPTAYYLTQDNLNSLQNISYTVINNQSCNNQIQTFSQLNKSFPTSETLEKPETIKKRGRNINKRNIQKELESAKKNSQSNIVNQLFSFFNSYQKSEKIVQQVISNLHKSKQDEQKIKSIFYNTVRLINFKRGRKYVNKSNILSFYTPQGFSKQIPEINDKLAQVRVLNLEQFSYIFRTITLYFIRNISVCAVLTSKRITMVAKNEHLKRRRRVYQSLLEFNK